MSKLLERYGVTVKEGDFLFKEGEDADSLFMIHSGSIKISRVVQRNEEILQILSDGEFVGEMAVIDSLPRSADAVALVESKLLRMDKYSFNEIIVDNNQFASSFISFLSKRIRNANDMMKTISEKHMEDRFYIEVLKEFMRNGTKMQDEKNILLLNLQDFLEKYTAKYKGDEDKFWTALESLVEKNKLELVKCSDNKRCLSLEVEA